MNYKYNGELWDEIIKNGRKNDEHKDIANILTKEDVKTIVATAEFFDASDIWLRQIFYDLMIPKFRVFDWLAMCIMGRNDDERKRNNTALKVFVYAFRSANYVPSKFIDNLRRNDYDVIRDWEKVQIDLEE
jgi:hypothetical protein